MLIPNSYGVELLEFNPCHSPDTGEFCSTSGLTRAGITSYRTGATNRDTFAKMRAFERQLRALPGVRQVQVLPAQGAYQGGWEPSWSVQYRGNGEARRLLAATGSQHKQSAVLVMRRCRGKCNSVGTEFVFDRPVGRPAREALAGVFADHGLSGWTWYTAGGKTRLRVVAVPHWGGSVKAHTAAVAGLSRRFRELSLTHQARHTRLQVETFGPDGEIPYSEVR